MNRFQSILMPLACLLIIAASASTLYAQKFRIDSNTVIQFSGIVVTEESNNIMPLPYTNVSIAGSSRGTISDENGFFSLAGLMGEEVVFSHIGYETVYFEIPDTLSSNMYSIVQMMTQDSVLLPEAVIYPWPSREYFDIEFLAMDVTDELRKMAEENLAENALAQMREYVSPDGRESTNIYLQQTARDYYSTGQYRPQNIFNAYAWKKFIEAWRRGDFKKKKKDNGD